MSAERLRELREMQTDSERVIDTQTTTHRVQRNRETQREALWYVKNVSHPLLQHIQAPAAFVALTVVQGLVERNSTAERSYSSKDMGSVACNTCLCNPSTWEVEAGGSEAKSSLATL